ncbi:MAG TPA: VOC family protein [Pseudomonadales bacterium]|nr:VOC family protein [Pseudomonadales bacterium]
MKLAKDCIDVGVQTNTPEAMLNFWQQEIGLPHEELLKVGGGVHQHRHSLNGSVFKLNSVRDPLPSGDPTGYDELLIAKPGIEAPRHLVDPDGNKVTLVPEGYDGITHIGIRMKVSSLDKFRHFYNEVLDIDQVSDDVFRWGTTLFFLVEDPSKTPAQEMRGIGYRYITVQVWKVDEEHRAFLERGGSEGRAPVTLGTTARISFIKDPDDNWIEVSQRASLTGDLS